MQSGVRATRRVSAQVPVTHEVQEAGDGGWLTSHQGSKADCDDMVSRLRRWHPTREYRVVPKEEAVAGRRRKAWSVNDDDHVAIGSRVMLAVPPDDLHPGMAKVWQALGLPAVDERLGRVTSRHRRTGRYVILLDGGVLSIVAGRGDFYYPVPDVVPLRVRK